jgi:hypothetical protein
VTCVTVRITSLYIQKDRSGLLKNIVATDLTYPHPPWHPSLSRHRPFILAQSTLVIFASILPAHILCFIGCNLSTTSASDAIPIIPGTKLDPQTVTEVTSPTHRLDMNAAGHRGIKHLPPTGPNKKRRLMGAVGGSFEVKSEGEIESLKSLVEPV